MSDDKVTIGGALSYAWSLWLQNWRAIWGVLAFYAVSTTVYYAGDLAHDQRLVLAGAIAMLIAGFAAYGAVFRLAFADEAADRPGFRLGPLGLQWGGMEWRMLGAFLLILLFFVLVGALAVVAVAAVIMGVTMAQNIQVTTQIDPDHLLAAIGPTGRAAINVIFFIMAAVMVFFAGRLSLSQVASAVSGRVQVLKSFALTRGHFLTIVFTAVVIELPGMLLGTLLMGGLGDPKAAVAPEIAIAIALVLGVFTAGVLAPLLAGSLAYFYRNLRAKA